MSFPDDLAQARTDELIRIYTGTAKRLRQQILNPPGIKSAPFNQARAASLLNQVNDEIQTLKKQATLWTGKAMTAAVQQGVATAKAQASEAGVRPDDHALQGAFDVVNHRAVAKFAQDTAADLIKGADGMKAVATRALTRMAATGVSNQEVNQILAGRGVIEGQPVQAIRELRTALEAVHGDRIIIMGKGGPREFDTGYYAKLVAVTKTRQAVVQSKHDQFTEMGLDLVKIIGRVSIHFCTEYLGHVYSLSGTDRKYPALSSLPSGGPPFHPQCSKSTIPFIQGLSKVTAQKAGAAA